MITLPPAKLIILSLIISLGGTFNYGYQLIILNSSIDVFKNFITGSFLSHFDRELSNEEFALLWSLITNLLFVGGLLGSMLVPLVAERWGRKPAIYMCGVLFFVACAASTFSKYAHSFELFIVARMVFGVAIGLNNAVQPMFLTEVCPDQFRGVINSLSAVCQNFGIILASIVSIETVLGTKDYWPFIYLLEIVPVSIMLVVLPFVKESPKFLLIKGNDDLARKALEFWHCTDVFDDHEEINAQMDEFQMEISDQTRDISLRQLWKSKGVRKSMLLGILLNLTISFSGLSALDFYSVPIMQQANLSKLTASYVNVAACTVPLITACLAGVLLDKLGRRPMLLFGIAGLIILNIMLMVSLVLFNHFGYAFLTWFTIAGVVAFNAVFSLGPGAVQFFLLAELLPQNARSSAMGIVCILGNIGAFVGGIIFYPLDEWIHAYSFAVFVVPLVIAFILFCKYLPETRNKPISEIVMELAGNSYTSMDATIIQDAEDDLPQYTSRKDTVDSFIQRRRGSILPARGEQFVY